MGIEFSKQSWKFLKFCGCALTKFALGDESMV